MPLCHIKSERHAWDSHFVKDRVIHRGHPQLFFWIFDPHPSCQQLVVISLHCILPYYVHLGAIPSPTMLKSSMEGPKALKADCHLNKFFRPWTRGSYTTPGPPLSRISWQVGMGLHLQHDSTSSPPSLMMTRDPTRDLSCLMMLDFAMGHKSGKYTAITHCDYIVTYRPSLLMYPYENISPSLLPSSQIILHMCSPGFTNFSTYFVPKIIH